MVEAKKNTVLSLLVLLFCLLSVVASGVHLVIEHDTVDGSRGTGK
jgi:hypothetical protein